MLNFAQSFFGAPAILVALFALVGNLLERRKISKVLVSVLTAAVGFTGITAGSGVIGMGLANFGKSFQLLFDINGTMPYSDITASTILKELNDIAAAAALIMLISMVLNIGLARMSRFKNIYLTGHHVLFMSVCLVAFIQQSGYDVKVDLWAFVLLGSLIMSVYMTLAPSLSKPYMEFLTQDKKIYIGHANSIGFAIAGSIGNLYGKMRKGNVTRSKDVNFPKWLGFFRNQIASLSITMIVIFMILYGVLWGKLGIDGMVKEGILSSKSVSPITQGFLDAFTFTIGVEFLVYGVKMMIGELVPAIEGFSRQLIPGTKTGVDCGIVLHYAPTAVLIGFLSSLIGGGITMALTVWLNAIDPIFVPAIILPGVVSHFFTGGTSATFGDIKGGVIGGALGAFVQGIIQTIIPVVFIAMAVKWNYIFDAKMANPDSNAALWSTMYTESDYLFVLAPIGLLASRFEGSYWVAFGVSLFVYLAIATEGIVHEAIDRKRNPQKYLIMKEELAAIRARDKKIRETEKEQRKNEKLKLKTKVKKNIDEEVQLDEKIKVDKNSENEKEE